MNTIQINSILRQYLGKNLFLGVFPSDRLPKIYSTPLCFVANTDPGRGEHWVAFWIDSTTNTEFFDSYARPPYLYPQFQYFFRQLKTSIVNFSVKPIQNYNSTCCGEYCIFYLYHKANGYSMSAILEMFPNRNINDCIVGNWIDERFDVQTPCNTTEGQICNKFSI